jgi:hypothetical protein
MSQRKTTFHYPGLTTLDTLAGAKWFYILDQKSGYWRSDVHADEGENCVLNR